jgi:8-amino-7-oxononanoate synthase
MADFDFLSQRLQALADAGRLRSLLPRRHQGIQLLHANGAPLINFGSNDYLGLAAERNTHPPKADPADTLQTRGGSGASALVSGWTDQHQRLADLLADFESSESAVLFPSGYAACCGTVATLAEPHDLILSDALNHASLIDGCRLSHAVRMIYPHRDCQRVAELLNQHRHEFAHVWIVTDGVFGMDGHLAPLDHLAKLAAEFDAFLVVDEAHGSGVLGEHGQGAGEALGVKSDIAVTIGSLSKAIGSQGGFVAGPQPLVDYLINRCRSLIYSTSLAPAAVAAAIEGVRAISDQPQRRQRLQNLSRRFRRQLQLDATDREAGVPIVPILIGSDQRTVEISQQLAEAGFYVPAIRPPTVPVGSARLRVSLSAAHDETMIDQLAAAIKRCRG